MNAIPRRSRLTLRQALIVATALSKAKQPRWPAGSPQGGQFRAAGSGSAGGPLPAVDGATSLPEKYARLGDMEGRKKAEALTQSTIKKVAR